MTIYKATKYDSYLKPDLPDNNLKIVEIYSTACLTERNGGFITLLAAGRGGLPGSINLSADNFEIIKNSSRENVKIDFSSAQKWGSLISKEQTFSGYSRLKDEIEDILESPEKFQEMFPENSVKEYFDNTDINDISKLIGRGVGLTPAGDDFIVGALNAACSFDSVLFKNLKSKLAGSLDRTTKLSRYYLALAAAGRTGEDMLDLLKSISEKKKTYNIRRYVQKITEYGASSGYYMIKGLLWALKKI
ncbi:MAG: DUF2877 domain-containing protein [Elusimicrobiota bacterium]|nr:DUF2877 domain-containing protein [Elusimicrobiota bacterium]